MRRRKLADFHDNHPGFRRWLYRIADWMRYAYIAFMVMYIAPLTLIVFILFFALPDDVRTPLTTLIVAIGSVFIVPLFFEKRRVLREKYKQNNALYKKLTHVFVCSISNGEINAERCHSLLCQYARENAAEMHLSFPVLLLDDVSMALLESSDKGDSKQLKKHVISCIKSMRRQNGEKGSFYFRRHFLDAVNISSSENREVGDIK